MAITIYRSDDVSAPLLTDTDGSFNAMLKAILVTGYGAKPGAGWTVELEDIPTYRTIFKNSTGKMYWVKHDRFHTTDGVTNTVSDYKTANIIGLESYKDINVETLMGTYPNNLNSISPDLLLENSQSAHAILSTSAFPTGVKWIGFADSKTIYLCIQATSYDDGSLDPKPIDHTSTDRSSDKFMAFGDYELIGHNDDFNGFIGGVRYSYVSTGIYNDYSIALNDTPSTNTCDGYIQRHPNGYQGAIEYNGKPEMLDETFYDLGGANYSVSDLNYCKYPYHGSVHMSRVSINHYRAAAEIIGYEQTPQQGFYRGFYLVAHTINIIKADRIGEWGDTFTLNGREYFLMSACIRRSSVDTTIAIDITGWD